jgi:hypothetical protein
VLQKDLWSGEKDTRGAGFGKKVCCVGVVAPLLLDMMMKMEKGIGRAIYVLILVLSIQFRIPLFIHSP